MSPLLPVALLATVLLAGACKGDKKGEEAVPRWQPKPADVIRGVPTPTVRDALGARFNEKAPTGIDADQWRHVKTLYGRFGGGPLWLDKDGTNEQRARALLRALVSADGDALRLDRYALPALARAIAEIDRGKPTADQLAEADVRLTSAYTALVEDLLTGQVNPRRVSQDWHIDPEEEAVDSALVRSLAEPEIDRGIARARPQDPGYEALRTELSRYRDMAKQGGWKPVPAGRKLRPGEPEAATRLALLRARLAAEGLLAAGAQAPAEARRAVPEANAIGGEAAARTAARGPAQPRAPRPGEVPYDAALAGAVAAYQARHAIVVDSVLGEETVRSMNLPVSYRLSQVAANMERHRWMPRDLGQRYIYVNVPAFRLQAFDEGKPALEMKVIVGQEYEDRKTAVFADTMTTAVFRPYWFVPDEIADKELWPKINADPGYLAANRMETFQEGGRTRLRQVPGEENSLGLVKLLFPNAFNIYLHDTPDHTLFDKDVRAFSHGCIRLEKPAELAAWVLGWDVAKARAMMDGQKDDQSVKLERPVPVYITYFTTYVQDGHLHFGNDLYERDAAMVKAITAEDGQQLEVIDAVQALRKLVA